MATLKDALLLAKQESASHRELQERAALVVSAWTGELGDALQSLVEERDELIRQEDRATGHGERQELFDARIRLSGRIGFIKVHEDAIRSVASRLEEIVARELAWELMR